VLKVWSTEYSCLVYPDGEQDDETIAPLNGDKGIGDSDWHCPNCDEQLENIEAFWEDV
jgi:hypothetical protein